ncbi:MAG: gamma carbonic anhydrase family protein [Solirubrobacterales bacterium]|nr:gamma carbonic anhydrase family protein [Solirubrobacterales bacterium]
MATIVELDGVAPTIGDEVFLAPTAVLVGDVRVGERANIWFGTVLRGDLSHIEIGAGSSIQDNAVVHCATDLPTVIGSGVVVGHGAMLEGCTIGDGALIGMGAIVLQHARVGAGAMLAAGAIVPEREQIAPGVLAAGVPARVKKELSGSALAWTGRAAAHYQELREQYLRAPGMDARRDGVAATARSASMPRPSGLPRHHPEDAGRSPAH